MPLQLVTAEGSRGRPHPTREVRRTALPWPGSVVRRVFVCVDKIGSMITASSPGWEPLGLVGARLAPPARNTRRDRSHGKHGGMLRLRKAIPRLLTVLSGTPGIRAYVAAPLRNTYRSQCDGEREQRTILSTL